MLPPRIPDPKLRTESTHPGRVVIQAKSGTAPATTYYIHPEWVHPEENVAATASAEAKAKAAPAVEGEVPTEHRVWKWNGKEVMHPMWAVRRLNADELRTKTRATSFNMEQHWKELTATVINGGSTTLWVVSVPMLTNAHDLETGTELLWESLAKKNKLGSYGRTNVNWMKDQMSKEKAAAANTAKDKKRKANELSQGGEI